jgi:hypothetical protein
MNRAASARSEDSVGLLWAQFLPLAARSSDVRYADNQLSVAPNTSEEIG